MNQEKVGAGVQGELFKRRRSEIPDAERVETLQEKLYQKAKQERSYKFYVLYDKMFIPYMLREAWKTVRANLWATSSQSGHDPKSKRRWTPAGYAHVRDRIAQTVCKMILEPIYEADFEESSYGFRPGRSSKDAMTAIQENLKEGKTAVYDADPRILKLINKWLKVPVCENGKYTSGKKNANGTPQGGVISPLLANVYFHLIDRIVNNSRSLFGKYGVRIVRYADDFVLMGGSLPAEITGRLKKPVRSNGVNDQWIENPADRCKER